MASQTANQATAAPEAGRRFRRNLFTGELEQVTDDPVREFQEIRQKHADKYRHMVRGRRRLADPYDSGKTYRCRNVSLKPEDATPERIAHENAEAKRHGTGAVYAPDGVCYLPTRGSRAKEFKRVGAADLDAGYSDSTGRL